MAIVVKAIHPKKFNTRLFRDEVDKALEKVRVGMLYDFFLTVATWKREVEFDSIVEWKNHVGSVLVGTDDEIYRYVNEGTRRHTIRPKKEGGKLVFPWGGKGSYTPKTKPRRLMSGFGGQAGGIVAFPVVQHPGTKARKFDETIQKKWQPKFARMMEKALETARKKSGHALPRSAR